MKKILLLGMFFVASMTIKAQTAVTQAFEKQYYIYNIITFSGSLNTEGFKVDVDNGQNIEKLKNAEGKKINFKTPAAALMYFFNEGWELYVTGGTSEGASYGGIGAISTTSYWIIRKPCTKEEFEKVVQEGIKK